MPTRRSTTTLEKVFTILEHEFDLTPEERREMELLVINFLKKKGKRDNTNVHIYPNDEWHIMEKRFKKKKRGNKAWLFPCRACKEIIDDTVNPNYWVRFDNGENFYFCSKECALDYKL